MSTATESASVGKRGRRKTVFFDDSDTPLLPAPPATKKPKPIGPAGRRMTVCYDRGAPSLPMRIGGGRAPKPKVIFDPSKDYFPRRRCTTDKPSAKEPAASKRSAKQNPNGNSSSSRPPSPPPPPKACALCHQTDTRPLTECTQCKVNRVHVDCIREWQCEECTTSYETSIKGTMYKGVEEDAAAAAQQQDNTLMPPPVGVAQQKNQQQQQQQPQQQQKEEDGGEVVAAAAPAAASPPPLRASVASQMDIVDADTDMDIEEYFAVDTEPLPPPPPPPPPPQQPLTVPSSSSNSSNMDTNITITTNNNSSSTSTAAAASTNVVDGWSPLATLATAAEMAASRHQVAEVPDASCWTVDEVHAYFGRFFGEKDASVMFDEAIDGRALLLLQRQDMLRLRVQMGEALKMYSHVVRLQTRSEP